MELFTYRTRVRIIASSNALYVGPGSLPVVQGAVAVAVLAQGHPRCSVPLGPGLTLVAVAGDQAVHGRGAAFLDRNSVANTSYTGKLIDYCLNDQF